MSKQIEALKLALEALLANDLLVNGDDKKGGLAWCMDGYFAGCFDIEAVNKQTNDAITAIREALAEQCVCGEPDTPGTHRTDGPCLAEQPAQQWTDETAKVPDHVWVTPKLRPLAKMAHEKQEPVAWLCMTDQYSKIVRFEWETFGNVTPLYTSPPAQRKPLTDEEIDAKWRKATELPALTSEFVRSFARAIEAKLREKNT